MGVRPFIGLPKVLSQWERARTVLNYREAQDLFFYLFCLAVVRWADDAKVVRAWYGVCFVEAMLLALGLRQHGEVYFMVRHSILSGGNRKRMNACPPPIPSKCVSAF